MRAGRLHARLDRLTLTSKKLARLITIFPEEWSPETQAAYDAAVRAGDTARQDGIIFQATGESVDVVDGAVIQVIEIRPVRGGPT